MSLTTSVQGWLRDLGPRERSALTARSHIAAETSTDVDEIVATVSEDVFFALPVRTRAGHELRDGSVLTTFDQVRSYYSNRSGSYVVRDSSQLKSLTTDWYVFNETAATLEGTGPVGEVDATGKVWVVRSIVLFPTADDGIRGEICATRDPMDDVIRGTVTSGAGDELANGKVLDRFSLAARAGDWDAVAAELTDGHTLAVRAQGETRTAIGRDASGEALRELVAGDDLTLLVRVATDWYVFAEYLLDGGTRRLAVIQPIEDGKVAGTFGYGIA